LAIQPLRRRKPQRKSIKRTPPKKRREKEKQIDERSFGIDGIDVGEPKVYDDSLLQQMLNAAQSAADESSNS